MNNYKNCLSSWLHLKFLIFVVLVPSIPYKTNVFHFLSDKKLLGENILCFESANNRLIPQWDHFWSCSTCFCFQKKESEKSLLFDIGLSFLWSESSLYWLILELGEESLGLESTLYLLILELGEEWCVSSRYWLRLDPGDESCQLLLLSICKKIKKCNLQQKFWHRMVQVLY